ncbi:MAG TPA: valine--tRNA ligase, partial [Anaerolineales bacterium]|nr:valine--tRNA ligase [Anaerolineales bacterium]
GAGEKTNLLKAQSSVIAALTGLDAVRLQIEEVIHKKPEQSMAQVVGPVEIHLPLAGMIDREAARKQLTKELANIESQIDRLEKLLASDFANKAPAPVVQKERDKLAGYKDTAEKIKAQLK